MKSEEYLLHLIAVLVLGKAPREDVYGLLSQSLCLSQKLNKSKSKSKSFKLVMNLTSTRL